MRTKRKMVSKILCGVLAVMTVTSGGLMFASASEYNEDNPLRDDLLLNPYAYTSWMEKNSTSGVYVHNYGAPTNPHSFNATVYGREADGSRMGDTHGGTYEIFPDTDGWLPNYVVEDGCDMAALRCEKVGDGGGYEVGIGWAADVR